MRHDQVHLYGQGHEESSTLTSVLGGFYAEMHQEGEMKARKTRRFEQPTFVKLFDPPRIVKVESVSATIVFTPKMTIVHFKAPNVAIFVLKSLTDDTENRFLFNKP